MHQTKFFSAALLVKTGKVVDDVWDLSPIPLVLNPDAELVDTNEDPIEHLSLRNAVSSFAMTKAGEP
jgi:hypothetical protein